MTMNIIRALNDNKVFGRHFRSESWNSWRAFLACLFGVGLGPDQMALYKQCTGRSTAPSGPINEAWLCVGRRGGKSFVLATIAVYLAAFKDWRPHLGPGEVATIVIIAKDRAQARQIKRFASGLLRESPLLAPLIDGETAEAINLRNRVAIEVHAASFRSIRGYTVVAAILDEIAFWESDESSAEPDTEIVNAIRPAMATIPDAMLLCASSPHARRGVLWDAHRKHFGQDGDPVLVWQAPTRVMNPAVPQAYIDRHVADDPAKARAEYYAEFRTDVEAFIAREVIEAAVASGRREIPRIEGVNYTGFVDPSGGSSDPMTLAITHVEDSGGVQRVVLDLVREVRPPFSPDAVVREFAALLRAYGIYTVHGDRYAGEWPRERFRTNDVEYRVASKPASDIYLAFLPILNSSRAELLDHTRMITQFCQLERQTTGGGREKIEHPRGCHDDIANAVAGAIVTALNAATYEVPITAMPVVAGGVPRSVAGGSSLGDVHVVIAPTPASLRSCTPATASPDAEREANRQRSNNDRSVEHRVMNQGVGRNGVQPSSQNEAWRNFVGGGNDGFFWGGRGGRNW